MNYRFPKDFMWGVGGSAFQMDGAMLEDGKTMNLHEAEFYSENRHVVFDDEREPNVCADFYHRYPEDLKLMSQLPGVAFRYSISWSRIIPAKDAPVNQKGVDFYNRLIDSMIENGITPFMDLYHSDLPQWVIDEGGIVSPEFIGWYIRYAEVCFREFGDRVKFWSTANEPVIGVFEAYANARSAPFEKDISRAMQATHNMILAHFEAVKLLRKLWPDAQIGMVNNVAENYCLSFKQEDMDAVARKNAYRLLFSDPIILGEYPKELVAYPPVGNYIPEAMRRQIKEKFVPMDFCGLNYYSPYFTRHGNKTLIGVENFTPDFVKKDGYGFNNYAPGMFDILYTLNERYHGMSMYITENGCAQLRESSSHIELEPFRHDVARQSYMREHIRECGRLLRAGVNLKGYFYWSFMDSWELRKGFLVPMGLVGVNFDTQERQPRDSFYYYQQILQNNMID